METKVLVYFVYFLQGATVYFHQSDGLTKKLQFADFYNYIKQFVWVRTFLFPVSPHAPLT